MSAKEITTPVVVGIHRSSKRPSRLSTVSGTTITLRDSQRQAFETLAKEQFGILNAPTGWGKSLVLCALAGADLLNEPNRKVVVCIPQKIIAKGFTGATSISLPDGRLLRWCVRHNLCAALTAKVDHLQSFLMSPASPSLPDRVVVTTHSNFASACSKLTPSELRQVFDQTTIVIDEAHHIQAADDMGNRLGEIVNGLLDGESDAVRLLLATAFFFRGDKLSILEDRQLCHFARHSVPFEDHWSSLTHLSSYRYDFVAYLGTVWGPVEKLLTASQEETIIYCPPEGHRLLLGKPKEEFIRRIIRLLKKHYVADLWVPGCKPTTKVILDLVDTQNRAEKVKFAIEHAEQIAAILTVGMFREGADWIQAKRIIDLIPTSSDQDRNQRFGRLIRDYPGKSSVSYYSFFPQLTKHKNGVQREELTRLFAHFHASLVLENALAPIKVTTIAGPDPQKGEKRGRPGNLLGQFDEQKQEAIVTDCHEALIHLHADAEASGTSLTFDAARAAMLDVLEFHGVVEHREPIARQITLMLRRRANLNLPVNDLVNAGFDKVWSSDALDGIRLYSAGFGGPTTFEEIRRVIRTVFDARWFDMYQQLKELPALPSSQSRAYWWMQNNKSLYRDGQLSADRVTLLEAIPWWEWQWSISNRWATRIEQISALTQCPRSGTKEYDWVRQQRKMYDQKKLPNDRIKLLERISWWTWNTYAKQFDDRIAELRRLNQRPKSRTYEYEISKYFRKRHLQGKLEPERIKELESISWWTW